MTASELRKTHETRKALRAINRGGMPWQEIAHQVNLLTNGRRVVTMDSIRRFVVEETNTRPSTLYWVERWLDSRAEEAASASAAVAR
ncbi:MAG: hypothetical protein IT181_12965 [Acidobacteria bacterium]|nr:hypothetical protein [Acidobacteriota bacterium]